MTSPDPSPVQASAETVKLVDELTRAVMRLQFDGAAESEAAAYDAAKSALLAHVGGLEADASNVARLRARCARLEADLAFARSVNHVPVAGKAK